MRQPRFIDPTTVTDQLVNESLGYTPQRDQNRTTDEVGRSAGQTDLTVSQGVKLRSRKIRHLQFSEGFNVDARAEIATVAIDPAVTDALQVAIDGKQPLDADLTTIAGLGDPGADRILFWDDSAGAYAFLEASTNLTITGTAMTATGGSGGTIIVQNNDVDVDTATGTVDFSSQFSVTSSPAGEANVSIADNYVLNTGDTMTGALVVNVTSTNALKIQDGGTDVFLFETTNDRLHGHSGADVVLYSDAGITETIGIYGGNGELVFGGTSVTDVSIRSGSGSPEGALSAVVGSLFLRSDGSTNTAVYRKESGTGNTGWVAISAVSGGATIVVQEGDVDVDTAVATLDFDASDFNVTSSPAGEANIALAYGTSAGTPAEGNHSHALEDLSDVTATSPGAIAGKVLTWDGSSAWDDNFVYTESLGPWFLNDVPGTATTAMGLPYFNTATALSRSTNPMRAGRTGYIVGARITSDAARSAGTCTVQVLLNGSGTAFDSGSVVLDGTRTTQDASIVTPGSGIAITSGSDTIGVQVVTSGWTPTTANIQVTLLVMWAPI